jgi:O-methyltransferase involved in polyketide biosynthesis
MENRLPLITRLTLSALGEARGGRVTAAIDPVAAWMLREQPDLHPHGAAEAAFTTIRARTRIIDRMIHDTVAMARADGKKLALWNLGPGFDARWYRLLPRVETTVTSVREVEEPAVLAVKNAMLEASPYAEWWSKVVRRTLPAAAWTVEARRGERTLVLLEGLAGRMAQDELEHTLERIHESSMDCTAILGLPGVGAEDASRWSVTRMRRMGWRVHEDARMGSRGRLILAAGGKECPGTYPLRVMRLERRT